MIAVDNFGSEGQVDDTIIGGRVNLPPLASKALPTLAKS
jgi:hypothetical protein